jgi:predicted GNAT superfamily acetyltransferase
VRPDAQNLGVGRRLKEFQRAEVARMGGRVIYWTFDPLVARNAHLNFNVFGVHVVEYRRDMYGGETGSDLHRGIGTDRLIVAWAVDEAALAQRKRETAGARDESSYENAPVVGDAERPDRRWDRSVGESRHLRVAIPLDISVHQTQDPSTAASWRASTRAAFEAAFAKGYRVAGFTTDGQRERGYYLLERS